MLFMFETHIDLIPVNEKRSFQSKQFMVRIYLLSKNTVGN